MTRWGAAGGGGGRTVVGRTGPNCIFRAEWGFPPPRAGLGGAVGGGGGQEGGGAHGSKLHLPCRLGFPPSPSGVRESLLCVLGVRMLGFLPGPARLLQYTAQPHGTHAM